MANLIREGVLDSDPINRDLKNMLWRVHKELGYSAPSPIQYDMCDFLQMPSPEGGAREVLMGFRGVAKSHITTVAAVWKLRRDRSKRILVTSATGRFAGLISTFAWQMINNFDWLADMKPSSDQRRSAIAFDVGGAPGATQHESFASVPITGQITGRRATDIIGDDLETPNTSDTEGARTELINRVSELGGAIIIPGGDIHFLGTAQTEDTLYLKLEERGYTIRIYPARYPHPVTGNKDIDKSRVTVARYGGRLAPFVTERLEANPSLAGTSTNPERFPESDLIKRRQEWGLIEFERQFLMLMDAGAGRGNPLKLRDMPVLEIPKLKATDKDLLLPSVLVYSPSPDTKLSPPIPVDSMTGDSDLYAPKQTDIWVPAEETYCYVDPSGEGTDETTWTIGAGLLGRIFVLKQGKSTEGHTRATMDAIAKDLKAYRCRQVGVESNFGQGMFGELLAPACKDIFWDVSIEDIRQGKVKKEQRIIETLEPVTTDNRLILSADLLREDFPVEYDHVEEDKRRYYRLTYQLTRMTKQKGAVKHDDRADGLSGLVVHFVGVLIRQLKEAEDAGKIKAIEVEAEAIIEARRKMGLPLYGLDKGPPGLGRPDRRKRIR